MPLFPLLSFLLFATVALEAVENAVHMLHPQNGSVHQIAELPVVVETGKSNVSELHLFTDDNRRFPIETDRERSTRCISVPLHFGQNTLMLRWRDAAGKQHEEALKLYLLSPVSKLYQHIPAGFEPHSFHTAKNESRCVGCHDMRSNERKGIAFENVESSNCHTCHKTITTPAFGHAPALNWLCGSCHSEQSEPSRFAVPRKRADACLECHRDNARRWTTQRFKHQPFAGGLCTKCHDPHASEEKFFLREPVNTLCIGCHQAQVHAETSFDPQSCLGGLKKLCTDCHDPHASNRPFFIRPEMDRNLNIEVAP